MECSSSDVVWCCRNYPHPLVFPSIVQVLNDLLDPTRTNLKIRVNSGKGIHVEGLKEEVVLSAEHALSLIGAGEANRKVCFS